MNRRHKNKIPLHGWINLHKPAGIGSTQALSAVKRALKPMKAGHGGTLDPLASGVLPIALGEATKTAAYAMDASKEYEFTVTWGEARSTDDGEGEPIETSDVRPATEAIEGILSQFIGEIEQTPPIYSAIKVDGKRAYDMARAGEDVALKSRQVTVFDLECLENRLSSADFRVHCGKGTYVRSLGRDIAKTLGTCGYISRLVRIRVGNMALEDAISLDFFTQNEVQPDPEAVLLPVQAMLGDILALVIDGEEAAALRRGQALNFIAKHKADRIKGFDFSNPVLAETHDGTAVAMVRIIGGQVKPERVFNL